jgi:hypothetical protein
MREGVHAISVCITVEANRVRYGCRLAISPPCETDAAFAAFYRSANIRRGISSASARRTARGSLPSFSPGYLFRCDRSLLRVLATEHSTFAANSDRMVCGVDRRVTFSSRHSAALSQLFRRQQYAARSKTAQALGSRRHCSKRHRVVPAQHMVAARGSE